jgi:hypothetical protein
MKYLSIVIALGAGLALGGIAAQAKLPPAPPMSDADKAAAAEKAAAAKAKEAELLDRARDKAVTNYKKNKGMATEAPKSTPASMSGKQ